MMRVGRLCDKYAKYTHQKVMNIIALVSPLITAALRSVSAFVALVTQIAVSRG
jgi:hypothetical protein